MKGLYTVQCDKKPSLEEAASKLGFEVKQLDASFGVVSIDPVNGMYGIQAEVSPEKGQAGPFSNPGIGLYRP